MDSISKELAEDMSVDDALEYLRHQPQFQVLIEWMESRKKEIEIGMGNATSETALRQCGQLSEASYQLDILKG